MSGRAARSTDPEVGIRCRRCGCRHLRVLYTRPTIKGRLLRRRECRNCGYRMTTYETSTVPKAARE